MCTKYHIILFSFPSLFLGLGLSLAQSLEPTLPLSFSRTKQVG